MSVARHLVSALFLLSLVPAIPAQLHAQAIPSASRSFDEVRPDRLSAPALAPRSLLASSASALHGQYAFLFQGITSAASGSTYGMASAGSFTADGTGNIPAGILDINTPQGTFESIPLTGSYTLDSTGRGTLSLTTSQGTQTLEISVPTGQLGSTVHSATGTAIDGSLFYGKGRLALQTPSAFTTPATYAVEVLGESTPQDGPAVIFGTGLLTLNSDLTASSISDQTIGTYVQTGTIATGTYTAPAPVTGRFTLFTVVTGKPYQTSHFAVYPIDATHLYYVSTDSHVTSELISGTASE